jgi:anti-sigma factor ChrR (cupin superfamily)
VNPRAFKLLAETKPDFSELHFEPFREGVEKAALFRDASSGEEVAVLRYAPGANVPEHEHAGYEYIFVLQGSQSDERGNYGVGTLVVNAPGTQHTVVSPEGCVVLAMWARPVLFK